MCFRSLLCVICFITVSPGQAFRESPDAYYIGRGEHASLDGARSRAYANLVEQIQVLVSSTLRTSTSENAASMKNSADRSTLSYSSIVLRDVQEHIDEKQGVYVVIKYVPKTVVQSIFERRRRQITDYLDAAEGERTAAAGVDLQRMLGNYYKAWLMTGLYPDTITYAFSSGGRAGVLAGIPEEMQRVCDRISFLPARKIDDDYTTWKYSVMWLGRPVTRLRFAFYDGLGESEEEVTNGSAQTTFLFTDKRERHIYASIEYHETDAQDALLAVADSVQAPFAPKLVMHFLLPGEPGTGQAVLSSPSSGSAQPAHSQLPAILTPFMDMHGDLEFFKSEIARLSRRGDIVAGKKTDFESLEGLYLFVLDGKGIQTILCYHQGGYTNMSGDAVALPEYAGMRTLWIKVQ